MVAVLLVLFGVGLCLCVILQYLRQQRDGPEGQYRPALSRDVYSVEAVNLGNLGLFVKGKFRDHTQFSSNLGFVHVYIRIVWVSLHLKGIWHPYLRSSVNRHLPMFE